MRGLAASLIALGLILAVIMAGGNRTSPTNDAETHAPDQEPQAAEEDPQAQGNVPRIVLPVKRVIECEDYFSLEGRDPKTGVDVLVRRKSAMGQEIVYLESPDACLQACGLDAVPRKGGAQPGKAAYSFELPREDDYYVFLRSWWFDNCGDSVYFRVDQGAWHVIAGNGQQSYPGFAWWAFQEAGHAIRLRLEKGQHTLELNVREDGPRFDKFLLKTDASAPLRHIVDP